MLQIMIRKLRKQFSKASYHFGEEDQELKVREGHFAVLAMNGSEKKRFVVKIECLSNPKFGRLLERAEEEFGFEHSGALMLPCTPQELKKILESCGYN